MAEGLGILLLSGSHERAHYAFVLASGAAAIGRKVALFATNGGCHALLADWRGLTGSERDPEVIARGVAGLDILREASAELGVALLVCEAGLLIEDLRDRALFPGVRVTGVASFLSDVVGWQLISL